MVNDVAIELVSGTCTSEVRRASGGRAPGWIVEGRSGAQPATSGQRQNSIGAGGDAGVEEV